MSPAGELSSHTSPSHRTSRTSRHDGPAISIRGLHKSFDGRPVLRGIDLDVPYGSTQAILGVSGSGKTVLLKHVIGLFKPDRGEVRVEGHDIAGLSDSELARYRKSIGIVFQNAALFDSMTVGENVAFPLREHRRDLSEREVRDRVSDLLEIVGLPGIENRMPAELSGGMRKRVGVARAVALEPRIVLYDEPTTGLDPLTTESVNEMITRAREAFGVTSLIISHDIGAVFAVADRIAVLHEGEMVAKGAPAEVAGSDHPHVRRFLHTWFGRSAPTEAV